VSRSTLVSVPDAEPHTTRRFNGMLRRSELDALVLAARAGFKTLAPRAVSAAQKAITTLEHLTAQADLSRKQREAGIPPKARHRGRA
jgi:hypothetical protein